MAGSEHDGPSDKTIVTATPEDMMSPEPVVVRAAAEVADPTIEVAPATIGAAPATIEAAPPTIETEAATIVSTPLRALPPSAEPEPERNKREGLDGKRMSLLEHLAELRSRLRNAVVFFVLAMMGSFILVQRYFDYLTRPVRKGMKEAGHDVNFYAKSLTEPFWVYMKLAIVGGLIIAGPFVFWEIWKFVAPGLYRKERRLTMLITVATAACFAGGAVFAYFLLCEPAAYYLTKLLTSFSGDLPFRLDPMIMMDEVANFQMLTLAGCGLAFELPVVLSIFGWMGLISSRGMFRFNRYAIVLAVVLGGVLTPSTDPFTQCLLAAPIFGLYNISILVVWLIERAARRRNEALERGTPVASSG
jgi:sec-independent protein translocase protein TatC